MVKVIYRYRDGTENSVELEEGDSLMIGAVFAGLRGIEGICGGATDCGTCHIMVDDEWMRRCEAPGKAELIRLGKINNRMPNSRLGCCIEARPELDGLVVTVAES